MIEIDTCIRQIQEAFSTTVYPGDDALVRWAANGDNDDPRRSYAIFQGQDWRTMTPERLRQIAGGYFFYLTLQARHFFLPALLLAELRRPEVLRTVYLSTVFALSPPSCYNREMSAEWGVETDEAADWQRFNEWVAWFNPAQTHAIALFLEVYAHQLYPESLEWEGCLGHALPFWQQRDHDLMNP